MKAGFITAVNCDAQTNEAEPGNGSAEAAKGSRQAAGDRKQAPCRADPQDSRQALREQISGAVSRDRCASKFWMRPGPPHEATLSLIFSHVAESDRRRGASGRAGGGESG